MEMTSNHISQEELERRLMAYFQEESAQLQAPADLWARIEARLEGPSGEGWLASLWQRLTSPRRRGLLPAFVTAVVLLLAVSGAWLFTAAPWQTPHPAVPMPAPAFTPTPVAYPTPVPTPAPGVSLPEGPAGPAGPVGGPGPAGAPAPSSEGLLMERMIVYQGSLSLAVEDISQAMEETSELAKRLGGFVVSSSAQGDEIASMTIRVPADKFEEAKQALGSKAVRVIAEDTRSQDVTEEYVDLQSSLRNWEAAESQYLELIKRAGTVEETLNVQRELVSVREQIERIKGRMNYLERTSAMAALSIDFRPARSPEPLVKPGWNPGEMGRSALRSLARFGQSLAGAAIWVGVYSPVWVVLGVVVFLLVRRLARR